VKRLYEKKGKAKSMDFNNFCSRMRREVSEFTVGGREETAAFLIWFLENYYRLETQEAIDCVCDHKNDKGIDGIYVDDEEEVIYLLQSKFSPSDDQDQGDNDIRNFIGARQWFQNENTVNDLLHSTASKELKSLIESMRISEKTHYKAASIFVTNKRFNIHAKEFIGIPLDLEAYDCDSLYQRYTYFADEDHCFPAIDLYLSNNTRIEYNLPEGTSVRVYSIKARELIKLEGIQDRTLFYKNVRYGVGNTRVNKSMKETIENDNEHNNFFLYHNGITIICNTLKEDFANNKISIAGYAVINGCQSMLTFSENKHRLSNNLFVLAKIINLNSTSPLIKKITYYANNQNSISLRDLRSNDSVQKELQKQFRQLFNNTVLYERKRGESEQGYTEIIDKDLAAQLIAAVFLGYPQNTHLKQKLFGEDYTKIFSRKISAEKIYLAYLLYITIKNNVNLLKNESIKDYGLAIFFFAHALSEILREDILGKQILESPRDFITQHKDILTAALIKLWAFVTPDINFDIDEFTTENNGFFDYKNVFKNSQFVEKMSSKIRNDYIRLIRRDNQYSFSNIYSGLLDQHLPQT
jgi:hypothetical protein